MNTNGWNRIRYSLWAPIYDLVASFPRHRRRAIELLRLSAGEKVLIVGAGTGADLPFIPATVQITAVDITQVMLQRLRQRATSLGMTGLSSESGYVALPKVFCMILIHELAPNASVASSTW